jgi:hypothetical protein
MRNTSTILKNKILISYKRLPFEALNNARKWILLGCEVLVGGYSISQMKTYVHIKDKLFILTSYNKTNKSVTIGIITYVIDIMAPFTTAVPHQKLNDYVSSL